MLYSDFTLKDLQNKFGIKNKVSNLFQKFESLEPSDWLKAVLYKTLQLNIKSEIRSHSISNIDGSKR